MIAKTATWLVIACGLMMAAGSGAAQQVAQRVFANARGAVVTVTTPFGAGTGFVFGDGTTLATALHVVAGAQVSAVRISLPGIRIASLVAIDEIAEVAIFRLSRKAPKSLRLHATGQLAPGTRVFVIGTPLGFLDHTISEGILSGIRQVQDTRLLQITAPISPGSSGGPVLDASGVVIGMVWGSIEEGQALNFAISSGDIRRVQRNPAARAAERPAARREGWPAGNARLADLASKLDCERWGDEAGRKLANEGAKAAPFLIAALRVFAHYPGVYNRAIDALRAIGKPAVEPLLRALSDGDAWVRGSAAWALGDIKDVRAVEPLLRALSDGDATVRWRAATALGKMADVRAAEPLIRALSDGDAEVRGAAAEALGEIKDRRALAPLRRLLDDPDPDVRDAAAKAVRQIEDARAGA